MTEYYVCIGFASRNNDPAALGCCATVFRRHEERWQVYDAFRGWVDGHVAGHRLVNVQEHPMCKASQL